MTKNGIHVHIYPLLQLMGAGHLGNPGANVMLHVIMEQEPVSEHARIPLQKTEGMFVREML